jgi:hypothetical protein
MRGAPLVPESEEFGVTSFVFRARRPFHPLRLKQLVDTGIPNLLRSKGTAWIANHNQLVFEWSSAGKIYNIGSIGTWFAEVPRSEWTFDVAEVLKDFDGAFGDRRQEIVFIGLHFDHQTVAKLLDSCLLTDAEFQNQTTWPTLISEEEDVWKPAKVGNGESMTEKKKKKKAKEKDVKKDKKKKKEKKKKADKKSK